jgi:hypothetical protein
MTEILPASFNWDCSNVSMSVLHCSTVKSLQFCSFWMNWHNSLASISLPSFEYLKRNASSQDSLACPSHSSETGCQAGLTMLDYGRVSVAVILQISTWGVLTWLRFPVVFLSHFRKCQDRTLSRPRPLPSKHFPIRYLPINPTFDVIQSET